MRVLLDFERLRNLNSGLGQFCLHLGKALVAEAHESNIDFTVYRPASLLKVFGNEVNYLNSSSLYKLIRPNLKTEILHCAHQDSYLLPRKFGQKMVLTIHDLNFLNKDYSNEKIGHLIKKLQTKVDRADALVFISNFSLQEATKYLTFDPSISHVIYNGLPQRSVPSLTKPDYIKNEEFIFSIGIISPKKNFKVLIPLLLENPALHLIVAGVKEGRYAREIEEYAKELNVLERLIMPGPVSDSDKSWLYKNCRAFMFPSIAEGFGLPVIEAMSFGKPVFLSTHTSLPEIGGVEAYYFDSFEPQSMTHIFAQGMKDFSQDLEKKNRLKRYAETYSWTKAAKQYIDLYKSI